jgi:transposase
VRRERWPPARLRIAADRGCALSKCPNIRGKLRLFFLPPYSPDRNPDELVWKHLKADTVGRMAVTGKTDFKHKVRSSMRRLQNDPGKIRSFYQKQSLKYAA